MCLASAASPPCRSAGRSKARLLLTENVLRARLAADDKYVRRVAKRVTAVAGARTPDEQYVRPAHQCRGQVAPPG